MFKTIHLNSLGPIKFFYKWPSNKIDIFESVISKELNQGLYVESWGRPWTASNCSLSDDKKYILFV